MALIDRTEFVRNLSRIPGWADADGDTLVSVADIRSLIYQARTVDAISVEWLRQEAMRDDGIINSVIRGLFMKWQKEQEAR